MPANLKSGNPAVRAKAAAEEEESRPVRPLFSLDTLDQEGEPLACENPPIPFDLNGRLIYLVHPGDLPWDAFEEVSTSPHSLIEEVVPESDWKYFRENVLTTDQLMRFLDAYMKAGGIDPKKLKGLRRY